MAQTMIVTLIGLCICAAVTRDTSSFANHKGHLVSNQAKLFQTAQSKSTVLNLPNNSASTVSQLEQDDNRKCNCSIDKGHADCSSRKCFSVPQDLQPDIISLYLSGNYITKLPKDIFARYSQLEILDLSFNKISKLNNFSFRNLSRLAWLDLHNNSLEMIPGTYPDDVFLPLESLTYLNINQNNENLTQTLLRYPDEALSRLRNLKELNMDGLNFLETGPLGSGFKNLTQLTNLSLAGYGEGKCKLRGLQNDTFVNVDSLENLNIADCFLQGTSIDYGALSPLKHLCCLNISYNEDIGMENINRIFYGLQRAVNLTHLSMKMINDRNSLGICLDSSYIKYFPQHLTYFDGSQNGLEAIDRHVLGIMPASLESLDLNGNRFVFGAYLLDLNKLKNLMLINLNGDAALFHIPKYYPYKDGNLNSRTFNSNCTTYLNNRTMFVLQLPPNLRTINMNNASLNYIVTELHVSEKNSLENLTLARNYFPRLQGPILGLHSLKNLDISFSYITEISDWFFLNLTSLESLILHSNLIGRTFSQTKYSKVFSSLRNLKYLDLSFNDIHALVPDCFCNLVNLSTLLLSSNPLVYFDARISNMNNIQMLALYNTQISTLSHGVRDHINRVINSGITIRVDMRLCQISCACTNLDFLTWMTTSAAFGQNFTNYSCSFPNATKKTITDNYDGTIRMLRRECTSKADLFFYVGSATLLILVGIIGAILFRFRWNLRYIYYSAYLRYKKLSSPAENPFEFDVFICYAEEDQAFVETTLDKELRDRDLKILLHRRDFTAGEFITSNIVKAVCQSKRTLVVLTRSLMESHWCSYEIEMAKMEGVYSGRQVLVFLIMEEIPREKLGRDLLYNIKNNTYLEYPPAPHNVDQMKVWWNKLVNDITS